MVAVLGNGVTGNYDLLQSELAEIPTVQALRDYVRIAGHPTISLRLQFDLLNSPA